MADSPVAVHPGLEHVRAQAQSLSSGGFAVGHRRLGDHKMSQRFTHPHPGLLPNLAPVEFEGAAG